MDHESSKNLLRELEESQFRVSIFGSARLQEDHPSYQKAVELGRQLAQAGVDVITGGGPGIMEAAAAGHKSSRGETEAKTIGIGIELPFEQGFNEFMEIKKEFRHFSDRLDQFMVLSNAVVVMDGGIGTALELFYAWQLVQVKHMPSVPIIVVGDQWSALIDWAKDNLLKNGFMSPEDMSPIFVVNEVSEIMGIIKNAQETLEKA